MTANLFKTKSSSLAKIQALPRFRHPADLLNEYARPISQQKEVLNGQFNNAHISRNHTAFIKKLLPLRAAYSNAKTPVLRMQMANQQYNCWSQYFAGCKKRQLDAVQRQNVFAGMQLAKERHEERLSLNRFNKWANEYAKSFKFDIPISGAILLKLVNPAFGYLSLIPSEKQFKYSHEEVVEFLNKVIRASLIREKGWTLHSEELMALIMWNIFSNKGVMTMSEFCHNMKYFKFNVTVQTFHRVFQYSLKNKPMLKNQVHVPFELFKDIYLDWNL